MARSATQSRGPGPDKYARRRRTVLGVVLATIVIVLLVVFGEAQSSPLHPVQQGISKVATPIGDGASKVVSPIKDLSGWVSSTVRAKSRNGHLRAVNAQLNRELGQAGLARQDIAQLEGIQGLVGHVGLQGDAPVYANVSQYDPEDTYESIGIDAGSASGLRVGDPVISADGLIGDISALSAHAATVAAISSPKMGVFVEIEDAGGHASQGTLLPETGNPRSLQVNYLPATATILAGDRVVTLSYSQPHNRLITSKYPTGIPVGTVAGVDPTQLVNDGTVDVTPAVDLQGVSEVAVLTHVTG